MTDLRLPRLLTLMGSGETSPTMVRVHRALLERLGPKPVPAVLLDTPFGFQENAHELTIRIRNYFAESLGTKIENASGIDPEHPEEFDERFSAETLTENITKGRYVFSGPGSPTYALRNWERSVVPQLLAEKLRLGGAVTFASAAALTLGAYTLPVYEIYKVGEEPRWLAGLDLLAEIGLRVAVIPHYNNAEGGTHDTRFCYLGDRRLRVLESELEDDAFVLGVDEHTSVTFDLDERSATVGGIGVLTVRKDGTSHTFASGATLKIDELLEIARSRRCSPNPELASSTPAADVKREQPDDSPSGKSPLLELVAATERSFRSAVDERDALGATAALLELEQTIHEWSSDVPGQDEMDRARAALRTMISELGRLAVAGFIDPSERVKPLVDALVALRDRSRADRRYDEADEIRDQLASFGVEIHDAPAGTTWRLDRTP